MEALSGCNNRTLMTSDLGSNKLSGNLPDSLGQFKFDGMILEGIGQLTELNALRLYGNSWNGVITENNFKNLTRLNYLSFSCTSNLLVNVRQDWIPPFSIYTMAISDCHLGPAFPSWLRTQEEISELALSNAEISDTIPDWLWGLSPWRWWLDLSGNQLRGELPKSIHVNQTGALIDLGFNRLEGPIPINFGQELPILRSLALSQNHLTGSIPPSINKIRDLSFLDLSNNHLTGEIPSQWQRLEQLTVVDLSNNRLSDGFPSSLCSLPFLGGLKLSGNNLSGDLSIALQNCANIYALDLDNAKNLLQHAQLVNSNNLLGEVSTSLHNCSGLFLLDLGENRFLGTIPSAENVFYLSFLRLRVNVLTGKIPEELCQFPNLYILDLARNNLSGSIPRCIGNLIKFKYKATLSDGTLSTTQIPSPDHMELVLKGREYEYTNIIPLVDLIDLSSNNFTGEIPEEIRKLSFQGTLNLSLKQLTGKITDNIGSLQQLETRDFSRPSISNHDSFAFFESFERVI
ncbi:hypothetical protein Pint_23703 [Pistacia integerrima]|uniref:Uncharacterized protein n=1 Tax=Pistacia integerrima TaxID=434235 RepID=A0ACC0YJH3_9ROSI|nr:hypothetical protein Pint_23703 [Pistacia integerrima]